MTASLCDLELAGRVDGLLGLMYRWDEFADSLSCHAWYDNDRILAVLTAMCAPFCHPLLGGEQLTDALLNLRSAVNAREQYATSGILPDEIDEQVGSSYDGEWVEGLLDKDVDTAMFSCLSATAFACSECVRIKRDVIFWQPPEQGSARCRDHRLVLAGVR